MWHGKSPISKAGGYTQGRTVRRGTQDSSVRNTNKFDSGLGAVGLLGFLIAFALFLALIGVI